MHNMDRGWTEKNYELPEFLEYEMCNTDRGWTEQNYE